MILIANFSISPVDGDFAFQSQNVAALWMVMPFSRSSSILSILAPTLSFPLTCPARTPSQHIKKNSQGEKTHLMDIAYPSRIVQNSFRERRLSRVYMRRHADVALVL